MNRTRQRGFTLIEILIVLVIIGILAMAIIPNLVGSDRPARIVTTKSNLASLRTVIQLFRAKTGRYPKDDLSDLLTESYNDQGRQIPFLREFPRELMSTNEGSNAVATTLSSSGGWYFDVKRAEVRVNYNKDLGTEWELKESEEKNPSKW